MRITVSINVHSRLLKQKRRNIKIKEMIFSNRKNTKRQYPCIRKDYKLVRWLITKRDPFCTLTGLLRS